MSKWKRLVTMLPLAAVLLAGASEATYSPRVTLRDLTEAGASCVARGGQAVCTFGRHTFTCSGGGYCAMS